MTALGVSLRLARHIGTMHELTFRSKLISPSDTAALTRLLSPDPAGLAAVDLSNPQSLNRYAYVLNNPLKYVDPLGLDCAYFNDRGDAIESIDQFSDAGECGANGGYWVDGGITGFGFNDNGSLWLTGTNTGNDVTTAWYPGNSGNSDANQGLLGTIFVPVNYFNNYYGQLQLDAGGGSGNPPTSQQYVAAISNAVKTFPNVCGIGAAGYLGNKVGAGISADTQNGVRFASGFNFVNAAGFKVNYTISGGANGNISYVVPIPGTKLGVEVGTQNGSLRSIQSIALSTNTSGYHNATFYMNISNMGDPNCR